MNNLSVYVILVNYRAAYDTLECVDSLKSQTHSNTKIIIVDNDASDNCRDLVNEKWPDVNIFVNDENEGFAKANNTGILYALEKGADYVLILNNDTVLEPEFVKKLVDFHQDHKEDRIGVLSGKILLFDERDRIWHAGGYINYKKGSADILGFGEKDNGQCNEIKQNTFASGCCMLMPSAAIKDFGLMSEEYFLYYEDVDYCCRILKKGYSIWNNNEALVYHKESVSTKKGSPAYSYYFARNRLMFIRKNIDGVNRIYSYAYTILWLIKKVIKKNFQLHYVWLGVRDFLKGITERKDIA